MEKMWDKKRQQVVDVATMFRENHLQAVVFRPTLAGGRNGNGWEIVRARNLIPMEYFDGSDGYQSKSYRNKMKGRLEIVSIQLRTTDGEVFDNYRSAIEHESEIYEKERELVRLKLEKAEFESEEHDLEKAINATQKLEAQEDE